MPTDDRRMGRGPMRSWLKRTLESGLLETLPASEATGGGEPRAFALDLIARLREADGGMRPDEPLAIAYHDFRRRVEAERKARRLGLLGRPTRRHRIPEAWPVEPSPAWPQEVAAKKAASGKSTLSSSQPFVGRWLTRIRSALAARVQARQVDVTHPLWDRWLDG
ncbi:hypothetical protein [Paludisphaera mucosa]|uniref:Uncharacterized protein n=1 Tax=Paludisphaera mucosa TaxID=3030827 RepID=A0ABT6F5D7_9BACT|nr:hypothetical protein [Paludisphaera mucosa]MDG3002798.1 hypothetical protein [Paludisphaera mucosa]